jgi:hypothetical protein
VLDAFLLLFLLTHPAIARTGERLRQPFRSRRKSREPK